jgi:small glutamine-rich tetratricopeptide repeat-containing protein alpha
VSVACIYSQAACIFVCISTFTPSFCHSSHAQYTLGDYSAAASAFRQGLELDPTNVNLKSGLANSEERISTDDGPPPLVPDDQTPPSQSSASPPSAGTGFGGMADMLRGMSGGAGGAGAPDIMAMMQNPQLMAMAQNMMGNGGLENLCAIDIIQILSLFF